MIAHIRLYEPLHETLKTVKKNGTKKAFVYIVEIGPLRFIKPSERAAVNFLNKNGFVLSEECTYYVHRNKSEDEIMIENLYKKV